VHFIEAQSHRAIELRQVAEVAQLSPFHFARLFKKVTGITPYQFALAHRIDQAKQRLLAGASIAEISTELGFYDQSHFSRVFKKQCGVTPKQFGDKQF
jgi:AraC family transcriptional regulator